MGNVVMAELTPALKASQNVSSITAVRPQAGSQVVPWPRRESCPDPGALVLCHRATVPSSFKRSSCPRGTRLQSSIVDRSSTQPGGMLQFELLGYIPIRNFGPGVPFQ